MGAFGGSSLWNAGKGKSWGSPLVKGFGADKGKGKGKKGGGLRDFKVEQRVWLGDVPEEFDRDELKEHLCQAGKCIYVSVSKGQGGAAYTTAEEAENAIAMLNGSVFGTSAIQVDYWTK